MELDLTKTYTLMAAFEALQPATSFLKDRYFPTNGMTDVFNTDEVLVDFKDNGKPVAPFVLPVVGGVVTDRGSFATERFSPPLIAPARSLSIDDLKKRGFGEAIFNGVSPAQRKNLLVMRDLKELEEQIIRREELMAAETMINDGCVMLQYSNAEGTQTEEKKIQFHEGLTNPFQYAPTVGWDADGAKIMQDLQAMIRMLTDRGLPAEELIIAGDVADAIINDPAIQKLLDNNRMNLGGIAPLELPAGASHIGTLNVFGKLIKLISYTETYEDTNGELKPYIPAGTVILTAPAAGRGLYGCVTQLEFDGEFYSYTGSRVPLYMPDFTKHSRTLTLSSCPVLIPRVKGCWISAKVTGL
jgi:hypothetical protein